jgi:hypothetical protein
MASIWMARLAFALALLIGAPLRGSTQQLYECTWTVTIREIVTTYANGAVETRWEYTRTEYSRPIQT